MLTLRKVDKTNWHETLLLTVQPEQQRFIGNCVPITAMALAKAYVGAADMAWFPYAIYAEEHMVGFFALAHGPNSIEDCWLFHFFIDQRFQRHGYGKAALLTIIDMVKQVFPSRTGISLLVHRENIIAQRLYQHMGFQPTGGERWGEPIYRLGGEQSPE